MRAPLAGNALLGNQSVIGLGYYKRVGIGGDRNRLGIATTQVQIPLGCIIIFNVERTTSRNFGNHAIRPYGRSLAVAYGALLIPCTSWIIYPVLAGNKRVIRANNSNGLTKRR